MNKVHLTREGYEKLMEELKQMKNVKRKEISQALEHARSLGDLRENAEYKAAKEAVALNEKRIRELEDKLSQANIIDNAQIDKDKVYIGAKVKLMDLEVNEEESYTLVGVDEADPAAGLISTISPVGQALLGHKAGDVVDIKTPAGVLKYKIIEISR